MGMLTGFGALLGGATEEAAKIRKEREDKEQDKLKLSMDMLQNIIENPNIKNPQLKEEAMHASRDILMEHLFPDNFKSKAGPLRKLLDNFVGQADSGNDYAQRVAQVGQPGVGRGNATSQVGGLPPQTPTQPLPQGPPPGMDMQAQGLPIPSQGTQAPVGGPPGPPQEIAGDLSDPYEQQLMTAAHNNPSTANFSSSDADKLEAYRAQKAMSALKVKENKASNQVDLPQELGGGQVDVRIAPILDTIIRAKMPDASTVESTTPDGHKKVIIFDKKTQQVMGMIDTGETTAGTRSRFSLWYDGYVREHHEPPSTEAQDAKQVALLKEEADIQLDKSMKIFNMNNPKSSDKDVQFFADQVEDNPANWSNVSGNKNLAQQVRDELATRDHDLNRLTNATRQLGETADTIVPKFDDAIKKINDPKIAAKLGPIMGRWEDFRRGTVGSGDPDFTSLFNTISLLNTGTMRAHVGARGSGQMLEYFSDLVDAKKMDPATLEAALSATRDFLKGYSDKIHPRDNNKAVPPAGANIIRYEDIMK